MTPFDISFVERCFFMVFLSKIFAFLAKIFPFTGKIGQKSSFAKPLTVEEEKDCFEKLAKPETRKEAEEKLVEHNLRLVAFVAKRYNSTKAEQNDLMSIGSIGLLKAVRTFDKSKANFSTYAARCIQNEILMFFRSSKKQNSEVSLSEPIGTDKEGNEITLGEVISNGEENVFDAVETRLEVEKLQKLIEKILDEREKQVVELRFGLFGNLPHTQKEVSEILGISRSYISRIETAALTKIQSQRTKN